MVIHKVSDNVDYPKSAKRLEAVIGNVWYAHPRLPHLNPVGEIMIRTGSGSSRYQINRLFNLLRISDME